MFVDRYLFLVFIFSYLAYSLATEEKTNKIIFQQPIIPADTLFSLYFNSSDPISAGLIFSKGRKEGHDDAISKYDGIWKIEVPPSSVIKDDYALVLTSPVKHHAVAAKLQNEYSFSSDEFVIQYEVKFPHGFTCGGGYIKLLSASGDVDLNYFTDKTPYTLMFGPDKCGEGKKLHLIFRHMNPISGIFEEKHMIQPTKDLSEYFSDSRTHLYTLVIRSDNSFNIFIDQELYNTGSLLTSFEPSVQPPKEIYDITDKKPDNWDDVAEIADQTAMKPTDWDEDAPRMIEDLKATKPDGWLDNEPLLIADTSVNKPADWDHETDGEWEPPKISNPVCESSPGCGEWIRPMVDNPNYKGKWSPPMIPNPNYQGKWEPRKILNPDYFEDPEPYRMIPISAIGLELWSMNENIVFDNFFIATSMKSADDFAAQTWKIKNRAERANDLSAKSVVSSLRETITDKPWMSAMIIIVVLLPLVFLFVYLCRPHPSIITPAGDHKKSDEPSPDDESASAPEQLSVDEGSDEEGDQSVNEKPKDFVGDNETIEIEEEEEEEEPPLIKRRPRKD